MSGFGIYHFSMTALARRELLEGIRLRMEKQNPGRYRRGRKAPLKPATRAVERRPR